MKKRLLSAALALAMVLTLLPVSAFAADEPTVDEAKASGFDEGVSVTYYNRQDSSKVGVTGPGWYYHITKNAAGETVDKYYHVASGIVATTTFSDGSNARWYSTTQHTTGTGGAVLTSGFTLLDDFTMTANQYVCPSTLSVNLDGHKLDLSAGFYGGLTATNITITNSSGTKSAVILGTGGKIEVNDHALTLNVTNAFIGESGAGSINLGGKFSHNVTLTNSNVSAISMISANDTEYPTHSQTLNVTGGWTAAITVTGDNSRVTLTDTQTASDPAQVMPVKLTGTGASLQLNGKTTTGAVTLLGRSDKDTNATPPSVSIAKESTVASIATEGGTEKCTNPYSVTVNGKVTNAINLRNANVTVDGGTVGGLITVATGKVDVRGKGSTLSEGVTLTDSATLDFTSATDATVGAAITPASTSTVKIPSTASNKYHSIVSTNYSKVSVSGGTWTNGAPDAKLLDSSLQYALVLGAGNDFETNGGTITYYTGNQLAEALTDQKDKKGRLCPMDQVETGAYVDGKAWSIKFTNGTTEWGYVYYNGPAELILPSEVGGVKTPTWIDTTTKITYPAGSKYTMTAETKDRTLDAQGGNAVGVISKLNGVAVVGTYADDLTASLSGTVITVSGAVNAGFNSVTVRLTTDGLDKDGKPVYVDVPLTYNEGTKSFTYAQPTTDLVTKLTNAGMRLEATTEGLSKLYVNTTAYTLKADMSRRNTTIKVVGVDKDYTYPTEAKEDFIDVTVNVPGYTTDAQKAEIIKLLSAENGTSTSFTWNGTASTGLSSVMKQAVNAALRTITESQVTNWIEEARRASWTEKDRAPYTATNGALTGYDTCLLVPYLQVNVTAYEPSKSITMTLVPSWRIEVVQSTAKADYKLEDNSGIYVCKNTAKALPGVSGDLRSLNTATNELEGGVGITFALAGWPTTLYAHQDGVYDYKGSSGGKFMFTHAGKSNGLGTVTIDTTVPQITVYDKKENVGKDAGVLGTYSTLQAAVDAAKQDNVIVMDQKYSGGKTVNVTGDARTFYIQANGNSIVIANASGGLVDYNDTGTLHTVRLNRNTAVVKPTTGDVTITVGTNTNGRASVSASKAKAGDTITVTVTPNTGYNAGGLTIRTDTGASVSYTSTGTNTYRFTVPENAKTITVTPSFVKVNTGISVNVTSTSYGTATTSAGANKVAVGTTVSVTTAPGSGYRTMGLYVTSDTGATSTATRTGVNSFVFTVPSATSYVAVTPRFDVNNGTVFEDVWSTEYYSSPVAWAVGRGITDGTSTYTFSPGQSCTRAQMVTFLWRAAGRPSTAGMSNPFYDVSPTMGNDFYNAILWAYANKITDGTSAHYFSPNATVTRAQAVTFLWRYAGKPAAASYSGFYDVPTSEYYAQAVTWAVNRGITNGDGSTVRFNPNGACLRAQIVTFLYRQATGARA